MKSRQIRKELEERGFELVRSTKHQIFKHPVTKNVVPVPNGSKDADWRDDRRFRSLLRRFDRGQPIRKEMG